MQAMDLEVGLATMTAIVGAVDRSILLPLLRQATWRAL